MTQPTITRELLIGAAYADREKLSDPAVRTAIEEVIAELDEGRARAATPHDGQWVVNEWVKQAIVLFFLLRESMPSEAGPMGFYDKIPMKKNWRHAKVRVVPPGVARYGSYLATGVILM